MRLKAVEEQVVVLMGASSGIGREAALRFAKRGAKVVVSARGEEGLASLVDEIGREGGEATYVVADTSEYEQVEAVAARAVEEYGRLDTWVHLAAVGLFATFEQTTPEEFARVIDVNLMGQVYGAMAALPHIKREGPGPHSSAFVEGRGLRSSALSGSQQVSRRGLFVRGCGIRALGSPNREVGRWAANRSSSNKARASGKRGQKKRFRGRAWVTG
jgi:NAD(P)-dependent dehydrogenase (short-subunit alcohol dehydrogenase family)